MEVVRNAITKAFVIIDFQMEESLGMVMIFSIISSTIEWLGSKWEEKKAREEEDIRRKKELLDLEEKVGFCGPVVVQQTLCEPKSRVRLKNLERSKYVIHQFFSPEIGYFLSANIWASLAGARAQ